MRLFFLVICFSVIVVSIPFIGSAQLNNPAKNQLNSNDQLNDQIQLYLNKSKKQNRIGWILLGGGFGTSVIGNSLTNYTGADGKRNNGGAVLTTIGGAAIIASIPVFLAASRNRNRARLASLKMEIDAAPTDSIRHIYIENAVNYNRKRSRGNLTAAVILTAAGATVFTTGLLFKSHRDAGGYWVDEVLGRPLLLGTGLTIGALSIPFYIKAAQYKKDMQFLITTSRVPSPEFSSSPIIGTGNKYLALGLKISF